MIVEMEYFEDGTNDGVKSIPTATEIGAAFVSGENVVFHIQGDHTNCREAYISLLMYEGPHVVDGVQCNPNFVIPGYGTLVSGSDLYDSAVSKFDSGLKIDSQDKLCFITGWL